TMVGKATFSTVLSIPMTTTHSDNTHSVHHRRAEMGSAVRSRTDTSFTGSTRVINKIVETGVYCARAGEPHSPRRTGDAMAKSAAPTTRVRDPEGTRRKIPPAALQEFAAKGL